MHETKDHPIAFASHTLNKHEINYSTTEKEALAIIWAVEKFRPYLYGNKFTLVTDHKPLIFIKNSNKNKKIIRWRLDLENYDYDVVYKTGKTNVVADALSRKTDANVNEVIDTSIPESIHSANTSEEFCIHFTERPLNNFQNQIVFREASVSSTTTEKILENYTRTTISRQLFDKESINEALTRYHNGKQTAIHAPEHIFSIIQEVYKQFVSNSRSHFVITQNLVEDITTEERQDQIVKQEHERANQN